MSVPVTPELASKFQAQGVALGRMLQRLHPSAEFEPPCVFNANIGPALTVSIGAFSYVQGGAINLARIGRYCSFAQDVSINQQVHPIDWLSSSPFQFRKDPYGWLQYGVDRGLVKSDFDVARFASGGTATIGNDVWIGTRAIVLGGIKVGDGAIIGAGAVVTKDVPPYAIVTGVPAKVMRYRFADAMIERLLRSQWWRFAIWDLGGLKFNDPEKALDELAKREAAGEIRPWQPEKLSP
jgi:acetyltransferase-like isoleucine patch superfamily enzyme